MAAEPDETRRLKELLSDTIVLLCKNGLQFEQEFSIEALVGITLDRKNVMLLSIRETINTVPPEQQPRGGIATPNDDQGQEQYIDLDNDNAVVEEGNLCTDEGRTTNNQSSSTEQSTSVINKINIGASAFCTNVTKSFHVKSSSSLEFHQKKNTPFADNDWRISCKRKKSLSEFPYTRENRRFSKTPRSSLVANRQSTDIKNINVDGRNCSEDNTESSNNPRASRANSNSLFSPEGESNSSRYRRLSATRRSEDSVSAASQGWGSGENSKYDFAENLGGFAVKVEEEECLDNVGYDASSTDAELFGSRAADEVYRDSQAGDIENKDFMRAASNLHQSSNCYDNCITSLQSHPTLSPDDVLVASAILSIPGCFINMGCVKAIRQSLRKVSKETLVTVLERMSVPESSPFFVGAFRAEGVSRTFYKCPPDRLHPDALALYNVQYSAYVSGYYEPVRYPNNLKDPTEWIIRWKTFSPFPDQRV